MNRIILKAPDKLSQTQAKHFNGHAGPIGPTPAPPHPEVQRPKEHGAYAMLGVPLFTSFLVAGFSWLGFAVAVAAVLGFLAHEPVMIATGRRGPRVKRQSPGATRRAVIMLGTACVLGCIALFAANSVARVALLVCLAVASVSFVLSAFGQQRSLVAQLWSVLGLTLPGFIVLLSGNVEWQRAAELGLSWVLGQASALVAVRSVIAVQKKATHGKIPMINEILLFGLLVTGLILWASGIERLIYAAPMLVAALGLRGFPPPVQKLRRVGWGLVLANVVSATWMVIGEWNSV